jgi:P-type Mg2+ transporter
LHAADVGISVDQAVDVARESADIILLKRDLDVLRTGVVDGRRTFANTLKYISITTSATFGNMVSMAIAPPLLPFLPLVAKQILWTTVAATAFALRRRSSDAYRRCSVSSRSRPSKWAPSSASSLPIWPRPNPPNAGSSAPMVPRPPDDSDGHVKGRGDRLLVV